MVLGTLADCASTEQAAQHAYDAARNSVERMPEAIGVMQARQTCALAEHDTLSAIKWHLREIYVLNHLGAHGPLQHTLDLFFSRFEPRHSIPGYTFVLRYQADVHLRQGNVADAFAILHRVMTITPVTQVQSRAETLMRLAHLQSSVNQYGPAEAYLRQAETLVDQHLTGSVRDQMRMRVLMAQAEILLQWYALEEVDEQTLHRARAAATEAYALSQDPAIAVTHRMHMRHLLGDVLTYAGRLDEAHALLQEAVQDPDGKTVNEHLLALYRLGRNRLRAGNQEESRRLFAQAYDISVAHSLYEWARRIRYDQGMLEHHAGNPVQAKRYLRDAIAIVEDLRAELGTTEWAASSISHWQSSYRRLARVLIEQDSLPEALVVLERSRARHLAALQARLKRFSTLDPHAAAQADSLLTLLSTTRRALQASAGNSADSLRMVAARAQERLDLLVGPPAHAEVPTVREIQRGLEPDNRTILYYVTDREDRLFSEDHATYVIVIRPDTLVAQMLSILPQDLPERLYAISAVLHTDGTAGPATTAFSLDALHSLYRDLVAPVEALLPPGAPLAIIPDGPLFALPFAALVTRSAGRYAYAQATYLGDRHPIRVDLSLSPGGSPIFAGAALDIVAIGKSRFEGTTPPLAPLPGVRQEVKAITDLFSHASTFLDAKATPARFAEVAPRSRVIHLATHAVLDETSPLFHAFVLSPTPAGNGMLYLHEIEALRLQAELVTLSGCNTARGNLNAGEGMAGLQYAFRAVGAQSTLSTLWTLSDDAGAELFEHFYRDLAAGLPKDEALQRAQQAYRTRHPDVSPFFWASPVLYGSPLPLSVQSQPQMARWPLWAGALLVLVLLFWWRLPSRFPFRLSHP